MALNPDRIRQLAEQEDLDVPPMTSTQAEAVARLLVPDRADWVSRRASGE